MSDELVVSKQEPRAVVALQPNTMGEMIEFAKMIATSEMVPKEFRGKPADIVLAVQHGAELGMKPAQALQSICVINGKPSLYGDIGLALVIASGHLEDIEEDILVDDKDTVTGAVCSVVRRGKKTVRRFTIKDAAKANLLEKPGPWRQYPARMCQMRARAWALRDVFPDVLKGMSIAEEVADFQQFVAPAPAPAIAAEKGESVRAKLQAAQEAQTAYEAPVAQEQAIPLATKDQKAALLRELQRRGINGRDTNGHRTFSTFVFGEQIESWVALTSEHYDAILEALAQVDSDADLAYIWERGAMPPAAPEPSFLQPESPDVFEAELVLEPEPDTTPVDAARKEFCDVARKCHRDTSTISGMRKALQSLVPDLLEERGSAAKFTAEDWKHCTARAPEAWGMKA